MPKMRKFLFWNEKGDEKETEQLSLTRAVKSVQSDFKDQFIGVEYISKKGKEVVFEIVKSEKHKAFTTFFAEAKIDDVVKGKGKGNNKKKAEQATAEDACNKLKVTASLNELKVTFTLVV